jgi:hypothetical protein
MTRFVTAAAVAALVGIPMATQAQQKPDLSGTWTLDDAKSDPAPARMGGGGGGRGGGRMGGAPAASMTIKQTASELTVERTTPMGTQTAVYKLDGSESQNTIGMGRASSRASWDGGRLVIATTQTMQGRGGGEMTIESKETYSRDGDALTLEVTRNTPMGSQTRKLVYARR